MIKLSANRFKKVFKEASDINKKRKMLHRYMSGNKNNPNKNDLLAIKVNIDKADSRQLDNLYEEADRILRKNKDDFSDSFVVGSPKRNKSYRVSRIATAKNSIKKVDTNYSKKHSIDPDEYIDFEVGGGEQFLKSFNKGNSVGTNIDSGGKGLYISDINRSRPRSYMYADRALNGTLDTAAIATGKIKAKYLNAPFNDYEAVIPKAHRDKIEGFKIKTKWDSIGNVDSLPLNAIDKSVEMAKKYNISNS